MERIILFDRQMTKKMHPVKESINFTKKNLGNVLSYLIQKSDYAAIALEDAPDKSARLCRAWLIQFIPSHPDYENSIKLVEREKQSPCLTFLNQIECKQEILPNPNASKKHLWEYFCPTAKQADEHPEKMTQTIFKKRSLSNLKKANIQLDTPASQLLFTSNILISPPIDPNSEDLPAPFFDEARYFYNQPQDYWYDHPIPLDASNQENELLYGLRKLDDALSIEKNKGVIDKNSKINMVLSISVTHIGMEGLAVRYVEMLINEHLNLKHLNIYAFDENKCQQLISSLCPDDKKAAEAFGVNGSYGRHYSFLKAILAVWHSTVNPETCFTFKIDLDQVFDQPILLTKHGKTALQLLCNPYWGGSALDSNAILVDLGMIAGGLVNEADSDADEFVPDVTRPDTKTLLSQISSRSVFCSQWPQAISTEAEIAQMQHNYQRVHVTGGTTGICVDALYKWRPFTPSFISRAEDQAFALSAFGFEGYLSHLHAAGLIMRHDKAAFAGRSIKHAADSKAIGDIERILFFSRYTDILATKQADIIQHNWPFTSCFISSNPEILAGLIFALDGSFKGGKYVEDGAKRLLKSIDFCRDEMEMQLAEEKQGWASFYDAIKFSDEIKKELHQIVKSAAIN